MTMIENPFIKPKHDKIKELDAAESKSDKDFALIQKLKNEIEDLELKAGEFIKDVMNELKSQSRDIEIKMSEVKSKCPSLTTQYKEMCIVYRDAVVLVEKTRDGKRMIREEIVRMRKRKQKVKK